MVNPGMNRLGGCYLHGVDPLFERQVTVTSLAVKRSVLGRRVLHVESEKNKSEQCNDKRQQFGQTYGL